MTDYKQGDVVLVRFVFTDESGAKRRPALILSTGEYHRGWQEAGLLFPSVATGIIRTIKRTMIERQLGKMPPEDMQAIQQRLRQILGL